MRTIGTLAVFRVEAFDPAIDAQLAMVTGAVGFAGGYALCLGLNWWRLPHVEDL